MPRSARIAAANHPHHLVQRGHNREAVFLSDADRLSYLATLRVFRQKLALKVYAYCLMPNHVHLVIDPGSDAANLGRLMKQLAARHTRRLNRLEGRSGTSWEGRYKCSPIQSDHYLLACTRYVDLNPVRARMVETPEEYTWSSYRARAGLIDCDWLDPDPCFVALGRTLPLQQQRYREFVQEGIRPQELRFIRSAVQRNRFIGCEAEVDRRSGRCVRRTGGRKGQIYFSSGGGSESGPAGEK